MPKLSNTLCHSLTIVLAYAGEFLLVTSQQYEIHMVVMTLA